MKRIEAIIRPEKFDEVKEALKRLGYPGMTTTPVEGHGRQKGLEQQFRGTTFKKEFLPKLKLEVVALDSDVDKIIAVIAENAKTGEIGNGKIFVSPVESALRIRTGDAGEKAL